MPPSTAAATAAGVRGQTQLGGQIGLGRRGSNGRIATGGRSGTVRSSARSAGRLLGGGAYRRTILRSTARN